MDKINAKRLLRGDMKVLRMGISSEEKNSIDRQMRENLFDSDIYKNAKLLLTFISVGDEPDTREILKYAWQHGKSTAVPKCLSDNKMTFYIIKSFDDCIAGSYGIPEPQSFCKEADLNDKNILCLVPGLAFDMKGARLGYGGGYYDRFLGDHPNIFSMGYCADRFITEEVPQEDTDIRLRGLITEKTVEVIYGK